MFWGRRIRRGITFLAIAALAAAGLMMGLATLYPYKYIGLIIEYSDKYGLPPALVCAVIHTESRFRPDAVSHRDAAGLMQLMPDTAQWAAAVVGMRDFTPDRLTEPAVNIELGCWYLRTLLRQFGHEQDTALAAYNAGSGNVSKWLRDSEFSADGVRLDTIPFGETARYVARVNAAIPVYRALLRLYEGIR